MTNADWKGGCFNKKINCAHFNNYFRIKFYYLFETIFLIVLGDHPEIQSESGNNQGGNYPCNCGVHIDDFSDLFAVYSSRIGSLEERRAYVRFIKILMSHIKLETKELNMDVYQKKWSYCGHSFLQKKEFLPQLFAIIK